MKKGLWNKRIPTLLGISLIVISIAITSILVKSGVIFISGASPTQTPQNIKITNIEDTSFTVTYTTDASVIGSINFGNDNKLGQSELDERDQLANSVGSHSVHSIKVTNLKPSSNYYFSIISGQNIFLNNGVPFQVATGPVIKNAPSSQLPIVGNVLLPDGTKPNEAIVYATVDGTQTISTLIKTDGSYILPLNSLRTANLSSYFNFDGNSIIKITIIGDSLESDVLISEDQVSPIPTVTLSKDYDFTVSQGPVSSPSAQFSDLFSTLSAQSSSGTKEPQILTPEKDEGFSDQQPLFKGNALPNQTVKITIHSAQSIQTAVTSDSSGNWAYRPSQQLSPGEHTITIQTANSSGIINTITQSFTVYASGTQVNESATPSAVLTPSPTITPAPPTPAQNSILITPTLTLTPIPTAIQTRLTPTPFQTKGGMPITGNPEITVTGIIGIGAAIVGGILFFL